MDEHRDYTEPSVDTDKEESREKKPIEISYDGEWYDVTKFDHPGEGAGIFLEDYDGQVLDHEIEVSHCTDEPFAILAKAKAEAKKKGTFMGIKFLGKRGE